MDTFPELLNFFHGSLEYHPPWLLYPGHIVGDTIYFSQNGVYKSMHVFFLNIRVYVDDTELERPYMCTVFPQYIDTFLVNNTDTHT